MNASDLATIAATLAFSGKNPVTNKQVLDAAKVPGVLAVMTTAGLYDDSGKWLYHTGLPAKSGVGGGIIAVSPGKFGIAVVSPPLDDAGNSVAHSARSQPSRTSLAATRTSQPGESNLVDRRTNTITARERTTRKEAIVQDSAGHVLLEPWRSVRVTANLA